MDMEKQLDYFSKNYKVVAMDPRSQGDSEQSSEGHYAFSMAKDIKAIVDQLGLEPLVLVGWSLGVPEVVNYAVHFGSLGLVGLVLIDGTVGNRSYRTILSSNSRLLGGASNGSVFQDS